MLRDRLQVMFPCIHTGNTVGAGEEGRELARGAARSPLLDRNECDTCRGDDEIPVVYTASPPPPLLTAGMYALLYTAAKSARADKEVNIARGVDGSKYACGVSV
ncbi:hypothetical protein E2C01_034035 [Portunus trituberculatus]|uniref:Uncharacterized protein n=1 Tax=Portunus trituberculatus TaxID=210409 RepID=A0A5B7F517_PORTR|nr:hypothetical protein [Portunus trituberculatus]